MNSNYMYRSAQSAIGLMVCAFGTYLSIRANIGLAPWDAFSVGVSNLLGCSYGTVVVITGIVVLLSDIVLREKIGIGTLLDIAIVGKCVDLYTWLDFVPRQQQFFPGAAMLILSQLILAFGIYVYMRPGLCCGPRDALMLGIGKRVKRVPIGAVRAGMEGVVLAAGFLLGAKVGLGTVIAVFGLGLCIQLVFGIVRFDAEGIEHEGFADMLQKNLPEPL